MPEQESNIVPLVRDFSLKSSSTISSPNGKAEVGGSGGPPGGEMEARVARLEQGLKEVEAKVGTLDGSIRDLEKRGIALEAKIDVKHAELMGSIKEISAKLDGKVSHQWLALFFIGLCTLILKDEIFALLASGTAGP